MKKVILGIGLIGLLSGAGLAQTAETRGSVRGNSQTSVSKSGRDLTLQSGTQLTGQLQNALDVQKARVGDQVLLKTTSAVKQNGRVVVDKGASLIGRVTEVQQRTRGSAASRVSVLFDRLENGKMTLPISAVVTSIAQAQSRAHVDETFESDVSGGASTRGSAQSGGGGGLLGGVTSTVGGVVNTTAQTVGGVTNAVGQTVGNTTQAVGRTVRGIQISQSGSASADAGSTLSLSGGNLRLEKGTTLNLRLTESISIGNQ